MSCTIHFVFARSAEDGTCLLAERWLMSKVGVFGDALHRFLC